ncbi:MAG: BON domain-containing protein [Gemmatimonadaceae bacterium]
MKRITTIAAAAILAFTAACGNTADGVKKDADNAADEAAQATSSAGASADAAMQTADVKTALMADTRVEADDINVDTNGDTKTVTLNGSVSTDAQKAIAAEIATAKAPGYSIVNNLTVKMH